MADDPVFSWWQRENCRVRLSLSRSISIVIISLGLCCSLSSRRAFSPHKALERSLSLMGTSKRIVPDAISPLTSL